MRQLLRSIFELDADAAETYESHIIMDGGIQNGVLGKFAIQLIMCLRDEVKRVNGDAEARPHTRSGL